MYGLGISLKRNVLRGFLFLSLSHDYPNIHGNMNQFVNQEAVICSTTESCSIVSHHPYALRLLMIDLVGYESSVMAFFALTAWTEL